MPNHAHRVVNVSIDGDQVECAIKVRVREQAAKSQRPLGSAANTARHRYIVEISDMRSSVQSDHFVIEIRNHDARSPRVVEIADINAHTCACLSVGAESESRLHGNILKFSIVQVAVEFVWLRIVGD